jgi:purine-binding chemotaxis protein CheW
MQLDRNAQILRERAEALAREEQEDRDQGERIDLTVFLLGDGRYAVESRLIREVVPCRGQVQLPCVPPFVAGIMNLRGRILALIDLVRLLQLPVTENRGDGVVLVLSHGEREFGMLADAIEGNLRLEPTSLREDFPTADWSGGPYLRGVSAGQLVVLDGVKLLNDPGLVVNEDVNT